MTTIAALLPERPIDVTEDVRLLFDCAAALNFGSGYLDAEEQLRVLRLGVILGAASGQLDKITEDLEQVRRAYDSEEPA